MGLPWKPLIRRMTWFRKISSGVMSGGFAVRTSGYYFTNRSKINMPGGPGLRGWQTKSEKEVKRKSVAKAEAVHLGHCTSGRILEREKQGDFQAFECQWWKERGCAWMEDGWQEEWQFWGKKTLDWLVKIYLLLELWEVCFRVSNQCISLHTQFWKP